MSINLYQWGWIVILFQLALLGTWLYDVYKPKNNRNDAAAKGLAKLFILAFSVYIVIGIVLMLFRSEYCTIATLCMAALPLFITIVGLVRYFKTR